MRLLEIAFLIDEFCRVADGQFLRGIENASDSSRSSSVVVVAAAAAVVVAGAAGASHIYKSKHIKNGLSGFKSTTMRSSCSIFLAWMIRRLVARRPQPQSLDYMHSQTR